MGSQTACGLTVACRQAEYLAVQNAAEEVGFVDLLTGRENHFRLVEVAQSAGMEEVHGAQLLHTGEH